MPAFPATDKQSTISADGRVPALAVKVVRGAPVNPLAITDLTITTTDTVATYHFTPPSEVNTSYLLQVATGTTWGGDRYFSAASGADGEHDYTGLTAGGVHKGRIFVNGVVSNTVDFTMQAAVPISDFTATTTETTATYNFTRKTGTVNYTFQWSLNGGASWTGNILIAASSLPAGPYTRSDLTEGSAYLHRVLADGTPSNVVDEPTKAAQVVVPPPPPDTGTGDFASWNVTQESTGPTLYVANDTGSDSNNGLSTGAPFATIQHAIAQATAGNKIRVKRGTYSEDTRNSPSTAALDYNYFGTGPNAAFATIRTLSNGTAANPITLTTYPGDEHLVIIDGQNDKLGLMLNNDFWIVENIKWINCHSSSVYSYGYIQESTTHPTEPQHTAPPSKLSEGCIIRNNEMHDLVSIQGKNCSHIGFWGTKGWLMHDNYIDGSYAIADHTDDSGINAGDVHGYGAQAYGCIEAQFLHNTVRNCDQGVYIKDHFVADGDRTLVDEARIAYNDLKGGRYGVQIGIRAASSCEAGHVWIHDNLIYGHTLAGVNTGMTGAKRISGSLTVEHNYIDISVSSSPAVHLDGMTPCRFTGNIIFTNDTTYNIIRQSTSSKSSRVEEFDYNVYSSAFKVIADRYSTTPGTQYYSTFAMWKDRDTSNLYTVTDPSPDTNSVQAGRSTVIDTASGDLKYLAAGSPAIGLMPDGTNAGPYRTGSEVIGRRGA